MKFHGRRYMSVVENVGGVCRVIGGPANVLAWTLRANERRGVSRMTTDETKDLLHRWYGEMWGPGNADLIMELAGPVYTRHEMSGTRKVTAEEYRDQTARFLSSVSIHDLHYGLVAEGDKVCAIGSWRVLGLPDDETGKGKQWDWVQLFRAEEGRLVETWLSGIGTTTNRASEVWSHVPR